MLQSNVLTYMDDILIQYVQHIQYMCILIECM